MFFILFLPRQSIPKESDSLETPQEKKERIISIRIIYFTMFLMSLGFSIILTGVWPYLNKVSNFPTVGGRC
jgi:ceroid-lipofuscinosis MFS transporter 7